MYTHIFRPSRRVAAIWCIWIWHTANESQTEVCDRFCATAHRYASSILCCSLLQCVAVCWLLQSQTEVRGWCSAISRRYTLLRMYGALLRICRALFRMYRALLVGYAGLCGRFVGLGLGRRSVLLHCPQVHIVKSVLQCIVVCCSVLGTRIDGLQSLLRQYPYINVEFPTVSSPLDLQWKMPVQLTFLSVYQLTF